MRWRIGWVADLRQVLVIHGHRLAPLSATEIDALVGGNSIEPRTERVMRVVAVQVPERLHKGLLCYVGGIFPVAEHPEAIGQDLRLVLPNDHGISRLIAC